MSARKHNIRRSGQFFSTPRPKAMQTHAWQIAPAKSHKKSSGSALLKPFTVSMSAIFGPLVVVYGRSQPRFRIASAGLKVIKSLQGIRTWNWKLAGQPVSNSRYEFGPQFKAETAGSAAPDELWANLVARSYHQISAQTVSLPVKIVSNAISV